MRKILGIPVLIENDLKTGKWFLDLPITGRSGPYDHYIDATAALTYYIKKNLPTLEAMIE